MVDKYDANSIVVLKGLDAVKKRPGMYFGDLSDGTALFNMLMEVVSNSVDQFLAGKASEISVFLHHNGDVEVIDNGEGMPVRNCNGKSAFEVIMTTLHAGATWDNHRPHTHVGTIIGIGLAPVNALCDYLEIDSYRDGKHWHIRFDSAESRGLQDLGTSEKHGTRMLFHPSASYFTSLEYNEESVSSRLEELSFLCKGLKFVFKGKKSVAKEYYCPSGIVGYLEKLVNSNNTASLPIFYFSATEKNTKVELALCWSGGQGCQRSFANHLCTRDGGVHVDAVILGLLKAASVSPRSHIDIENLLKRITKGLYFVVHVNIAAPQFAAPTKDRLINEETFDAVVKTTYLRAKRYFAENTSFFRDLEH